MVSLLGCYKLFIVDHRARNYFCRQYHLCLYISSLVLVFIVTVMFILNFVHCETTACDSDNKQSLILSYLLLVLMPVKLFISCQSLRKLC